MGAVVTGTRADDEVDAAVRFPWAFFALAFGFTWLVCLPGVLAARGLITLPFSSLVLIALAQCGPSLAAGLLVYRAAGRPGVLALLRRALAWRIPLRWLVPTLGLPPLLAGGALGLFGAAGGPVPDLVLLTQPVAILPVGLFTFLLQGPVPEEL